MRRSGREQCDDLKHESLDGCDAIRRYETVMRVTKVGPHRHGAELRADTANTFGKAFATEVAQAFTKSVQDDRRRLIQPDVQLRGLTT